jgi:hypothetical protein
MEKQICMYWVHFIDHKITYRLCVYSLEIRGMTAIPKGGTGKRDKFRKTVSKSGVAIYGPKHSQSSGKCEHLFFYFSKK